MTSLAPLNRKEKPSPGRDSKYLQQQHNALEGLSLEWDPVCFRAQQHNDVHIYFLFLKVGTLHTLLNHLLVKVICIGLRALFVHTDVEISFFEVAEFPLRSPPFHLLQSSSSLRSHLEASPRG